VTRPASSSLPSLGPARSPWALGLPALAGFLFAVGLGVSGMTQQRTVIDFLDLGGAWDPSLALVMVGAVGVHFVGNLLVRRRAQPLFDDRFHDPPRALALADGRLLAGAALFGVGWGLGGFCPGPALVTAASAAVVGARAPLIFLGAMMVGMVVERWLLRPRETSALPTKP
jgi:uncharacterized protein